MNENETELLVVPHTHWDREWYLTFQQFRMKLVDTLDAVLETLESDPAFTFFMLDGQTIILEDYLQIRPENARRLQALTQSGRLLVGPWYLQPDEFLVGGESLIRNLQKGQAISALYGGAMPIGYVPDTFGHIAQLPQLLQGFGIDNAVFWRGVGPDIKRDTFRWLAPDGSEVLVAWLCDDFGYANAALLPTDPEALAARVQVMASRMRPWAGQRRTLLLMNGGDHLMPQAGLPRAIAAANTELAARGLTLRIATLPQYVASLHEYQKELPIHSGELRSSYRSHLLAGVYSTRLWLKQQNAASEALLTRWAEPATCWAWVLGEPYPATQLDLAWKFLMENHPHDSICGCSIDQVHREMMPRFAQSQQIAGELVERALRKLASQVDTSGPEHSVPVVVFNVSGGPRTEAVRCSAQTNFSRFEVVDSELVVMPHQVMGRQGSVLLEQSADKEVVVGMLGIIHEGRALGYTILDAQVGPVDEAGSVPIEVLVAEQGAPDLDAIEHALTRLRELAEDERVHSIYVTAREAPVTELVFVAENVPAYGGKTFYLRPVRADSATLADDHREPVAGEAGERLELGAGPTWLENERLRVEVEADSGLVTIYDKAGNARYSGLNRLVDSGDVGDLYTYCPPAHDVTVDSPTGTAAVELLENGPARASLRVRQTYRLPARCLEDRTGRSEECVDCEITTDISLSPGSRRVEFRTSVENEAEDHRLRVVFPLPFLADSAYAEGAFEVTRRPAPYAAGAQTPDAAGESPVSTWAEMPADTQPQRRFVDVSDGELGLALLSHGLPEYELLRLPGGCGVALTLLRCTGWLSRNDLATRQGHAGPQIATPEAQGRGRQTFEYALVPHAGTWETGDAEVLREADRFEAPLRAMVTEQQERAGSLPEAWSFLSVTPPSLSVSAIKRSVDGDALILRLYNPMGREVSAEITLASPFEDAQVVDLGERPSAAATGRPLARVLNNKLRATLRAGEIQTLRLRMAPFVKQL